MLMLSGQALRQLTPEDTGWASRLRLSPASQRRSWLSPELRAQASCSDTGNLPPHCAPFPMRKHTCAHACTRDHTHTQHGAEVAYSCECPEQLVLKSYSLACFPLNNYNHLCPAHSMHVHSLHMFPDHSSLVPQYEDQPKLVRLEWRLPLLGPSTSHPGSARAAYTQGRAIACRTGSTCEQRCVSSYRAHGLREVFAPLAVNLTGGVGPSK